MTTKLVNRKPTLFGEGEDSVGIIDTPATAGLGGGLSITDGNTDTDQQNSGTSSSAGSSPDENGPIPNPQVIITISNNNSTVGLAISGGFSSGSSASVNVTVEESAVVKASGLLTMNRTFNLNLGVLLLYVHGVSAGAHTYDIVWGGGTKPGVGKVDAKVAEVNDSHAGTIATSATATKQVNVADSHTTHEGEILS